MDRLSQLRGEAGGSGDSTLDTTSPPSEAYMSANESSSKYFSLADCTFDITPLKDVTLAAASSDADRSVTNPDELMPNLSPIGKKEMLDSYKIGKQIEAANILSGGVDIFDDNDNSFDGEELVIDDNVESDDKSNPEKLDMGAEDISNRTTLVEEDVASKDTEVVLQIDGKNVNAIDIGNGLYLYRKDGQEELAAVQINEDLSQPSFKFLKVRENSEGNLEVYEEIEIEVPKESAKEGKRIGNNAPHVPVIDINKVMSDSSNNKVAEQIYKSPQKETAVSMSISENDNEEKDTPAENKEVNFNGKMMKISESRKSPVVGSFTPMTFHSTPNKEGKPLTKTMVDLQLDPNRHTDNVKKTIEVHTETIKHNILTDPLPKEKDLVESIKLDNTLTNYKEIFRQNNESTNKQKTETVHEDKEIPEEICDEKSSLNTKLNEFYQEKTEIFPEAIENVISERDGIEIQSIDEKCEDTIGPSKTDIIPVVIDCSEVVKLDSYIIEKEMDIKKAESGVISLSEYKTSSKIVHKSEKAKLSNSDIAIKSEKNIEILGETVKDYGAIVIENNAIVELKKNKQLITDNIKTEKLKAKMEEHSLKIDNEVEDINVKKSSSNQSDKDENISCLESTSHIALATDEVITRKPTDSFVVIEDLTNLHEQQKSSLETISVSNTSKIQDTDQTKIENVISMGTVKLNTMESTPMLTVPTVIAIEKDGLIASSSDKIINIENNDVTYKSTYNENSNIDEKAIKESTPILINTENIESIPVDRVTKTSDQAISNTAKVQQTEAEKVKNTEDKPKISTTSCQELNVKSLETGSDSKVPNDNQADVAVCALPMPRHKSANTSSHAIPRSNLNVTEKPLIAIPVTKAKITVGPAIPALKSNDTDTPELPVPIVKPLETSKSNAPVPKHKLEIKCSDTSVPSAKATDLKVHTIPLSEVKTTESVSHTMPVPKMKARELTGHAILVPEIKARESMGHVMPKGKDIEPKGHTIPAQNVKAAPTEIAGHAIQGPKLKAPPIIPVLKVKATELAAPNIPVLKVKTTELATSNIPVLKVKATDLMTPPIPVLKVKATNLPGHAIPVSKVHSATMSELKPSDISSTVIDKTAKPGSQNVEVKDKLGPKNIELKASSKVEEVKKSNDTVSDQKETIIAKNNTIDKKNTQVELKDKLHNMEQKPVNNNHTAAVPFGKWTEVNRQEFLNKFKEVKAPVSTTSKQIKNSNDLNRRDFLKKIDSQRQQTIINNATSKAQEKLNIKNEIVFSSKIVAEKTETIVPAKKESIEIKAKQAPTNFIPKPKPSVVSSTVTAGSATVASATKVDSTPRLDLSTATMATLIDKTIEDMITRVVPNKNVDDPNVKKIDVMKTEETAEVDLPPPMTAPQKEVPKPVVLDDSGTLDDIEMKMNELHGIPFVERPPHELPKVPRSEIKTYSKSDADKPLSKVLSSVSSSVSTIDPKVGKDNVVEIDSDEEVIEHEPITGDMEVHKKAILNDLMDKDKISLAQKSGSSDNDTLKRESIITETDFDKFARRNSITYENRLTVSFEKKDTHSMVQTVQEKKEFAPSKLYPKNKSIQIESKSKLPYKQQLRQNIHVSKTQSATSGAVRKDVTNKQYQSKIHSAYHSALTAKRQVNPITILEDKPVKVVFLESNTGFVPSQLNVQGQELSPPKKPAVELDMAINSNTSSMDSDILETLEENKHQDKIKTKHQRKQVLTPVVEAPEIELIQPRDIGIETSPKKKRKIEEHKIDKQLKTLVPKKSYLLGRNTTTDNINDNLQGGIKETKEEINVNHSENIPEHKNTASAIDSLVKAAELLDNQAVALTQSLVSGNSDSQQSSPVKRGRGRPRKYPLPDEVVDNKPRTPQKKPRLIDAKPIKQDSFSDDDSEDEIVRENWTMGKINENIVCPICNKLFRSENVVFKHVKHCTGVSPNRSESDNSPRRRRPSSQDSDDIEEDCEKAADENKKKHPKKRKSNESTERKSEDINPGEDKDVIIVIEDTPVKEIPEKHDKEKVEQPKKVSKTKVPLVTNNISCEICGKMFRQQSYLVNHKLLHKREQIKQNEKDAQDKLQVFSCEVCKKEFRKLHHLVQHRIIHDPDSAPTRTFRKSSSEQIDTKSVKEETVSKQNEDQSAAFRCEPCDKSFRKLHHLVEHRETHDGINRQKITLPVQNPVEKIDPPPQCEICKKTFRKLHHLIEHKEQHADAGSDKSDDKSVKSVKSSLSTKDIIHECSSCYMVFPNEHSLNRHSTLCAKKKRQSKQPIENIENESEKSGDKLEDNKEETSVTPTLNEIIDDKVEKDLIIVKESDGECVEETPVEIKIVEESETATTSEIIQIQDVSLENTAKEEPEVKTNNTKIGPSKRILESDGNSKTIEKSVVPEKIKKNTVNKEAVLQEPPKKKTPLRNKVPPTVTKRQKSIEIPVKNDSEVPVKNDNEIQLSTESDDEDIRYMLNPNYKVNNTTEGEKFMKVRASKRNSLQIERTCSIELVTRRTSIQHPPKIPRLKPIAIELKSKAMESKAKTHELKPKPLVSKSKAIPKIASIQSSTTKHKEAESVLSTDSDDSDIKYSFPKTSKILKLVQDRTSKDREKKTPRKSLADKRRSLAGIAKRKSLGNVIPNTRKTNASPVRMIKKRTREVEHRCDCGQLFSSAALLGRHTSLAHTPPRIRRKRSPPPDIDTRTITKQTKSIPIDKTRTVIKSTGKSDTNNSKPTRKSSVKTEATNLGDARKSIKAETSEAKTTKTRRHTAHQGVPIPEKMRKLIQKSKK